MFLKKNYHSLFKKKIESVYLFLLGFIISEIYFSMLSVGRSLAPFSNHWFRLSGFMKETLGLSHVLKSETNISEPKIGKHEVWDPIHLHGVANDMIVDLKED